MGYCSGTMETVGNGGLKKSEGEKFAGCLDWIVTGSCTRSM